VASVEESPKRGAPCWGKFFGTAWLWTYRPVKRLARLGQQSGVVAKAFVNPSPVATSSSCTAAMYWRVSQR
jgi:hypothetical protein